MFNIFYTRILAKNDYICNMSRTFIHKQKATYHTDKPQHLFRQYLGHANRWNYSRDECRAMRKELEEKIANREMELEMEEWEDRYSEELEDWWDEFMGNI